MREKTKSDFSRNLIAVFVLCIKMMSIQSIQNIDKKGSNIANHLIYKSNGNVCFSNFTITELNRIGKSTRPNRQK